RKKHSARSLLFLQSLRRPVNPIPTPVIPSEVEEPCVCFLANHHSVILRSRGPSQKDLDDEGSLHSAAPHTIHGEGTTSVVPQTPEKDSGVARLTGRFGRGR